MDFSGLDRQLFFLINHGTSFPLFDLLMPFLTGRGYLFFFPFLGYIFWKARTAKARGDSDFNLQVVLWAVCVSLFSLLLSDWMALEIKNIVMRQRPCNALEGVKLLAGCTGSYSMPSNHATNSFAAAVSLVFLTRRYISPLWSLYLLTVAGLIAFSRVYVGVHYPSDIFIGALLGTAVALLLAGFFKYTSGKYKKSPYITLLYAVLVAISIFRIYYILHGPLDLSPDEAHYWEWSRRLDLSYYSKGPMVAYLIRLGTSVLGDTVLGVRILAVVCSAASSIFLFRLAHRMYDRGTADSRISNIGMFLGASSALIFQIIPLFAPFGVIFTIDSPFIFFWTLSLYLFWNTITSEDSDQLSVKRDELKGKNSFNSSLKLWLLLGVSIGLGLLTKYTMAFFYLCGVIFLLISGRARLLKTFKPYVAVLVSLAVFSPVLIWNVQHDWVTFRHTAGQAHIADGVRISFKSFLEFFGSQIGVITPIIFGMMMYALFKLRGSKRGTESDFLFAFSIPVIVFFLLKSIQGKVQANWAMPGYITGIIAFSSYFLSRASSRKVRYGIFTGIGLALFVTVVSHYPAMIRLPLKLDPSARLRGWHELGVEVANAYDALSAKQPDKANVLIFSDSYQVASEVAFYTRGHPKTYCVSLGRRMNQYDLWPDMNSAAKEMLQVRQREAPDNIRGIFVTIGDEAVPREIASAFARCDRKVFKVYDRGRLLRDYTISACYNFKGLHTERPKVY